MIYVLEGPDGGGKSTLAKVLAEAGAFPVHHGPYKGVSGQEMASVYMASMKPALAGQDVVMDRSWLSEPIYAEVYRGSASRVTPAHQAMLERAALAAKAVVILCQPRYERCLESFNSGRDEMLENDDQLAEVYERYRFLGRMTNLPVVTYDYTSMQAHETLAAARSMAHSRTPLVVLLGDRPNVRTHVQSAMQVPFVSFTGRGCSEWLAKQLIENGIGEYDLMWLNAFDNEGRPVDKNMLPPGVLVIAMGNNATRWCAENRVSCRIVPHPQAHKRFYFDKPYPLIREIKNVIRSTV